jgi:transcriptional regulator with XRE-family HTH domain
MALRTGKCLLGQLRQKAGLTQNELSYKILSEVGLSITAPTISKYENDRLEIPIVAMRGLCIVLGCTESDLYEWPL